MTYFRFRKTVSGALFIVPLLFMLHHLDGEAEKSIIFCEAIRHFQIRSVYMTQYVLINPHFITKRDVMADPLFKKIYV